MVSTKLEILRNKVLNLTIVFIAIFACIDIPVLALRSDNIWHDPTLLKITLIALGIIGFALLRKKISKTGKIIFLIIISIIILITTQFAYGFLASSKIYIIGIAVLLSFVTSYKKVIGWLILFLIIYGIFGILYSTGYLEYHIDANIYVKSVNSWIIDAMIIFFVTFGLLYIGKIYNDEILSNLSEINTKNTLLVQREKKLNESNERYKILVESFPDIIKIADLNDKIIFGNKKLEEITGITEEDFNVTNRKAKIFEEDKNLVLKAISDLVVSEKEKSNIFEYRFVDINKNIHWFSSTFSKLYINNELFIQEVSRDITDKKLIELELEKHRNKLEVLVQERTAELEEKNLELEKFNELFIGREFRIKELKDHIAELKNKLEET